MKITGEAITGELIDMVEKHNGNIMGLQKDGGRYYEPPLIGFTPGNDPIFEKFREVVSPEHITPVEAMTWLADSKGTTPPLPEEITVISYILPLNRNTVRDNASSDLWLSERWAQTRLFGEDFNQLLAREMSESLINRGILAVPPEQTPLFKRVRTETSGIASTWSHRHIAYAAGLGTFGMHDFFITRKGSAHRCGSFIVNLKIEPVHRRHEDIHAFCLHYQKIPCLKCAERCPVGAISETGHDKDTCSDRVQESRKICRDDYKLEIYGCGLCSTAVPCESGIPLELKEKYGETLSEGHSPGVRLTDK